MENDNLENIELENVMVPDDDRGDLIAVLFQAGFSDEESDIVLDAYNDLILLPEGSIMVDEEILKIVDKFELENIELSEEDLSVIRSEFIKRFS